MPKSADRLDGAPTHGVIPGQAQDVLARQIRQLAEPLQPIAEAVASIVSKYPALRRGTLIVKKEPLEGSVIFERPEGDTGISVIFEGNLAEGLDIPEGTPYLADWTGQFFRGPKPAAPPFVEDKTKVKNGQIVGWFFVDKGVQGAVRAHIPGTIRFNVPNEGQVKENETVVFYTRPDQQQ